MKVTVSVASACALAGCSTHQAHGNLATSGAPTGRGKVPILCSPLQRAYTSIGIVSANRDKPGWTDPTVSDAIPQLQAASVQISVDAVLLRSNRSNNDRHVAFEREAIKFTVDSTSHRQQLPA